MKRIIALLLTLMLCIPLAGTAEGTYPMPGNWELTIWCEAPDLITPYFTNAAETPGVQDLERLTGVKLNFIHPTKGQVKENFNLLVAGGDIPDIMYMSNYAGGEIAALEDGVYADLTDYVEKYMPNYWNYLQTDDQFRRLSTLDDGRIIAIYNYKTDIEPYWWRTQFRKDFLEEFGMEEPCTIAEYEAFFDKVLDKHPEVVPFSLPNDGINGAIMCAWNVGVIYNNGRCIDYMVVDGKIHHPFYEQGYYEYLSLMHKWYEKGYISKDFMSEDPTKLFQTGKVACITGNGYEMFPTCKELGIAITSGPYARLNRGDKIHTLRHYWPQNGGQTFVSGKADPERLAAILTFLDYGFTKDGIVTFNFGAQGTTWDELGENGFPRYNDNILNNPNYPVSNAESILKIHGYALPRWRYGDGTCMATNQKAPENWDYRARWGDDPDVDPSYGLPPIVLSSEDSERRAEIMNNVETHAKEMTLKYITGAADLANFDKDYTQVLKNLGIEEAISITQAAYDNYMSK